MPNGVKPPQGLSSAWQNLFCDLFKNLAVHIFPAIFTTVYRCILVESVSWGRFRMKACGTIVAQILFPNYTANANFLEQILILYHSRGYIANVITAMKHNEFLQSKLLVKCQKK